MDEKTKIIISLLKKHSNLNYYESEGFSLAFIDSAGNIGDKISFDIDATTGEILISFLTDCEKNTVKSFELKAI